MKLSYFSLLLSSLFLITDVNSQNLVTNGSFEAYTSCPTGQGEITLAPTWINPTTQGTADLYNACVDSLFSAPQNVYGYQATHTGNGYAGIYAAEGYRFSGLGGLYVREYIQTKLTDSMLPGRNYRVSFFISLAEYSSITISNIGAYLSTTPVSGTDWILADTPQVTDTTADFITDTIDWHKIEGIYTATGGEQYITIGNFDTEANIQQIALPPTTANTYDHIFKSAYYYIDDVSVELINNDTANKPETELLIPNVFSPNGDNTNDEFKITATGYNNYQLTIYNRWGQQVFESNDANHHWNGKINNTQNNAPAGTYYYLLTLTDATTQTKVNKGFLTLVK